ncbi:hypothetical protein BHF71_10155 [Vulcanibacillus modesticaldus]|uniref:DUF2357 domain-containing protein n=1 Tax=Vulcanibacillus modesticaldus TaxID=337097 RepID=A0A1D2YTU8_9BACI|nr:DUF2357 domain-containing protein [Vulcanibacillus modesticaldus]OEF99128.1 hypothetical protein BHF71_10155 [Vulcanibacillus modesticaldus]
MEQHNFGVNIEVWDNETLSWTPIEDMYLKEGTQYRWRSSIRGDFILLMQQIPIMMTRTSEWWEGVLDTPFESGIVTFTIYQGNERFDIEQYIYPDSRKITNEQYEVMLQDILSEAKVLFKTEGLKRNVSASGRKREVTWLQWNYIERTMSQLRNIFLRIEANSLRFLNKNHELLKREQVKIVNNQLISWVVRHGEAYGGNPNRFPEYMLANRNIETFDLYENKVILRQVIELETIIKKFYESEYEEFKPIASKYLDWLYKWRNAEFLKGLSPFKGTIRISQVFRKHPLYRVWYQWYQKLYEFKDLNFDVQYKIPLKETHQLYEVWVYIQIIIILKELGLIEDSFRILTQVKDTFFLKLSENKKSTIQLKNGAKLSYQRKFQSNTYPFKTYTHAMIPDIVIEYNQKIYILDPKYRIPSNLSIALGEMHKYRDGIIHSETNERVVEQVYIVTPKRSILPENKDFFTEKYRDFYKMGAFSLSPGEDNWELKDWLSSIFNS